VGEVEDLTSPHPPGFHPPHWAGGIGVSGRGEAVLPAATGSAGHGESDQRSEAHQDDNHDEDGLPDTRQEPSGLEFGGE
jgi:hypothetical protein